jgi:7-cyano-7-deazaguanine synthase in queuosine biosynthesis
LSRLILFSGGVESIAMLTKASKDDIVMTIRDTSLNHYHTYHPNRIEEVARAMKVQIQYTDIKIPIEKSKGFVYQLWTFIPITIMWASRFPEINEIWYGLNNTEPSALAKDDFEKCVKIWKIAFPQINLRFPLRRFSKEQQWSMIPKHIRPLITTCLNNNFCGTCRKCIELKKLRGL